MSRQVCYLHGSDLRHKIVQKVLTFNRDTNMLQFNLLQVLLGLNLTAIHYCAGV